MATLTVTAKGQITLKQDLLRHLKVAPGEKVEIEKLPDGRLVVAPARETDSIEKFSGFLATKGGPKLTIEEINEIIERGWAGEL
jgi:bifunctional DNA-binding transcriptional regulator/antitoxin component of YhaV-PrlF toxin-antitoxin module